MANIKRNIRAVLNALKKKKYTIYDRPYELNIVSIREDSTIPNKFDDTMYVIWKDDNGEWQSKNYPMTTDPGTYYLKVKLLSDLGAAILKEGQYKNTYGLGTHYTYEALTQKKPVTVYRDYNRDAVLDFNNGREETGLFGINIHRASRTGTPISVDEYSAGCQVFQNPDDFAEFMQLARKQRDLYGNSFTYSLIDERAFNRMLKRRGTYIILSVLALASIWSAYRWYNNKPILKLK